MKKQNYIILFLAFLFSNAFAQIPQRVVSHLLNENFEMAQAYFDSTKTIDAKDSVSTKTPLMFAAQSGFVEFLNYCLANKADVNEKTILGETALVFAVQEAQEDAVRILVEHDADVNIKTKLSQTPLIIASGKGNLEIVKMLVEKGPL